MSRLLPAHEEHTGTVDEVKAALREARAHVTQLGRNGDGFEPEAFDLVITIGGDGTLLSASHAVSRRADARCQQRAVALGRVLLRGAQGSRARGDPRGGAPATCTRWC